MEIVAINQRYLTRPELSNCVSCVNTKDLEMLTFFSNLDGIDEASHLGLMPRSGINNLPFKDTFIDLIDSRIPQYNPNFSLSWEDVMDQRAWDIQKEIIIKDKTLVIQWSGGIDSTGIVVSVLKNFVGLDDRVIVACNWGSIIENPVFYHKHIKSRFSTVDINKITKDVLDSDKYLIVGGSAADTLLTSMAPGLEQCMAVSQAHLLTKSWRKHADEFIKYVSGVTNSSEFGKWYFEKISTSIESVDVPVENYFEFMWWAGFNYNWHAQVSLEWFHHHRHGGLSWQQHQEKYHSWFKTNDFQLWSMANNKPGIKFGQDFSSIKHVAKKYIFDYTKDQWYYQYKTKLNSAGRAGLDQSSLPFAVTDDFRVLCIEKDLDLIQDLLPKYIKL
jgi:hypothetical protein